MSDENQQEQPQEEVATSPVEVESKEQFFVLLQKWHDHQVACVEHMLSIPEGVTCQINDGDPIEVKGDFRTGFMAGLTVALSHFGTLPFSLGDDEEEDQNVEEGTEVTHVPV